jgi:hypothetical protein
MLHSATSQVPGQKQSPQIKDRECDNVLPGVGSRTFQQAVIEQWWNDD